MQGGTVTSGLKKVTDDMKTKNRADRSGAVPSSTSAPSAPTASKGMHQHAVLPAKQLVQGLRSDMNIQLVATSIVSKICLQQCLVINFAEHTSL